MAEPSAAVLTQTEPDNVRALVKMPRPPSVQTRVDRTERFASGHQFGDLKASTLTSILSAADKGDIAKWDDLCRYAISTDADLTSLNTSRALRVVQADQIIKPAEYGDPKLARLAAELVTELFSMVERWQQAQLDMLYAIGPGVSANQMLWDRIGSRRLNYVKSIEHVVGHRFRYDEQWQLRLYDQGRARSDGSMYGESLDPRLWIVHQHQEVSGYPGGYGVMRACIWDWMFARWVEKFWILEREKWGSPFVYANVDPNTKESVRNQILEDLQNLSNEHVAVIEGHEIQVVTNAMDSKDGYETYLKHRQNKYAKAWAGASDAMEPGANGARAAVETRVSANMDPRMVADGTSLNDTLRHSIIKQFIAMNVHLLGVTDPALVPIPERVFKTADDEVRVDQGDRATEIRDEDGTPAPVPGAQPKPSADPTATPDEKPAPATAPVAENVQQQALNGAQVTSLIDLVARVAAREIPRSSAVEIAILSFQLDRAAAERVIGEAGGTFEPKPDAPPPFAKPSAAPPDKPDPEPVQASEPLDPKARAPVSPGQTAKKTTAGHAQTSMRYPSPFAKRQ